MEKQTTGEATDIFICKKRRLFAQLAEKLSETTMLNIIYSQILLSIRERIPRDSVNCFQDLLQRARDVEMLLTENKKAKIFIQASDDSDKILMRCTFCRKKNHTSETCYKKLEADRKGKPKVKESTISCYGCGLAGYYRSKCPNCNKKNPINSPERLDFNSIQTSIIGRNVPTVGINISGLKGTAYFDTAARTSVAGYTLFQKLKEKKAEFQKVVAEIVLADGVAKKEVVYSTIADIIIGGRFKRIRMICLPNAKGNRTLIGIDFLEQAGIVLDLAQRIWHFKDNPNSNFEFKMNEPKLLEAIPITSTNIQENNAVDQYFNWLENADDSMPQNAEDDDYTYSPREIDEIFEGCLPQVINNGDESEDDWDLFPPLKRVALEKDPIEILSIDLKLCKNEGVNLNNFEKKALEELLNEVQCVFEDKGDPVPHVEHYINTGSHSPISCTPYRISPVMREKLKIELDEMLKNKIIVEAESPWAFPVVLIPKKSGKVRVCVDYRKLNAITLTDKYPLPRMDDLLHAAKASKYMSTIDLKSGYWQIKMSEKDKIKTAFTTPFGIFIFNRMPFGLKNAPATFQRLVDKFSNGLPQITILAYLDDIIICSKDFGTHLKDLRKTFERIQLFNLQLNREKCHFCRPEVKYLGHILTIEGLKPNPEKKQVRYCKDPIRKIRSSLFRFCRHAPGIVDLSQNFAEFSKPLSNLTKKGIKWKWQKEEVESFDSLKHHLVTPPILQQVDETKSFCLKTDASNYTLGAVLLQGEKYNENPIEYGSRLLLAAEKNYSTTEREALAVVWAVKKFRGYIEGSEISVLTDHQPLKWLFSLKSPTGRLARWALELQPYNIQFGYMPGRQNIVADTLSRPPCPIENHIDVCECFAVYIDFPRQGAGEIRKAQLEDDELEKIIKSFEEESHNIIEYIDRGYMMMDGVLYRYCSEQETENGQLVVPKSMRSAILWKFHDDPTAGHYGVERTISRMLPHYYW